MTADDRTKQVPRPKAPPPQGSDHSRVAAFMEGTVAAGATAQELAAIVAAAFRDIDRIMVPVIGERGMAALYRRTLHLARQACPWLPSDPEGIPSAMDIAKLTTELSVQTAADAATGGTELLQTFHALLTNLIGESLTERLLRSVWATFLSGHSARDPKS